MLPLTKTMIRLLTSCNDIADVASDKGNDKLFDLLNAELKEFPYGSGIIKWQSM
jgi:hypothetical protein